MKLTRNWEYFSLYIIILVIYCYLQRDRYKILKFDTKESLDFEISATL